MPLDYSWNLVTMLTHMTTTGGLSGHADILKMLEEQQRYPRKLGNGQGKRVVCTIYKLLLNLRFFYVSHQVRKYSANLNKC